MPESTLLRSIDAKTHEIVGYDVDFAKALAKSLGVKLELVATNPANRIPSTVPRKADLIVADIAITPERAQVIGTTRRLTLSPASSSWFRQNHRTSLMTIAGHASAAVKGTTGEQALHQRFPQSRVLSYDEISAGADGTAQWQRAGHYPGQHHSGRSAGAGAG